VRNSKSLVFVIVLAVLLAGPVQVGARQSKGDIRTAQADVGIGPDQAAAIARSKTKGQVLSVNLARTGNPVYRVKVLMSGGRVRTVIVDAKTGRLLN